MGTYRAALINWGVGTKPKTPGGLLGFADDNWLNGTQSGVFSFVYPEVVPLGYGMTTTMTHEYGHHSSMSHPHDGYDSATGVGLRAWRRHAVRLARRHVRLDHVVPGPG